MNKISVILGVSMLLLLGACKKEISNNDNFNAYTGLEQNDTIWQPNSQSKDPIFILADTIFKRNFLVDSFDLSRDITMLFGDSLEIDIKGNSLVTKTGLLLTGKAKIEILRIQRKGDFIKSFRQNSSFGKLLESAGGFFINISINGTELFLAPGKTIIIRYFDIEIPKTNMRTFYGNESKPVPIGILDTAHNWIPDTDSSYLKLWNKLSGNKEDRGYVLESKNLRFICAERAISSSKPLNNIYAILPPNFTNKNSYVFAVFENNRTVLWMKSDYSTRSFKVGNIPTGTKIKLVSVSKIGADLYLGTKSVQNDGVTVTHSFTPQKKTLAQIVSYLNSL